MDSTFVSEGNLGGCGRRTTQAGSRLVIEIEAVGRVYFFKRL